MKKTPMHWVVVAFAVLCVIFAGTACVLAMHRLPKTKEKLDETYLAIQDGEDQIDEIWQERAEQEKAARQKALDAKKEAQASQEESDQAKQEQQEADSEEEAMPEEPINSFAAGANGRVVGIDPGHQGYWVNMSDTEPNGPGSSERKVRCTTGTESNYGNLTEYQLNLDVSLKLRDILEGRGYRVVMTREDNDANISNMERAQKVAQEGAEIYVRIHANSSEDPSVSGALSMCPTPSNPYVSSLYGESRRLSEVILDSYCRETGMGKREIQEVDNMTGINWSSVPVTILEMGFMSNQADDAAMSDSAFQQKMAEGIANGIDAYFGVE